MLGSSSWMPHAPQGVKGTDDDDDESPAGHFYVLLRVAQNSPLKESRGNINSVVIFFHDILDIVKCLCFLDHTRRRSTVGRTPLDE
jgi:hypothetical protein